jgi:hypothetical protein
MEKRALGALLRDHADNEVVRIRWVSDDDVSAIVTVGELREALRNEEIDPADIESLQFLS